MKNTTTLATAALLTAFTYIATSFTSFNIGTAGYIHLGDAFVLICGYLLNPFVAALAAGTGSMISDIFLGYSIWAPGTFIIKAGMALIVSIIVRKYENTFTIILSSLIAESFMVLGYFVYGALISTITAGDLTSGGLQAGFIASATSIPANLLQAASGVIIAFFALPVLKKIIKIANPGFIAR